MPAGAPQRAMFIDVASADPVGDPGARREAVELALAELLGEGITVRWHASTCAPMVDHAELDDPDERTYTYELRCSACGCSELEVVQLVRHRWPIHDVELDRESGATYVAHAGDGGYTADDDGMFEHVQCTGCAARLPVPLWLRLSFGTYPAA